MWAGIWIEPWGGLWNMMRGLQGTCVLEGSEPRRVEWLVAVVWLAGEEKVVTRNGCSQRPLVKLGGASASPRPMLLAGGASWCLCQALDCAERCDFVASSVLAPYSKPSGIAPTSPCLTTPFFPSPSRFEDFLARKWSSTLAPTSTLCPRICHCPETQLRQKWNRHSLGQQSKC